MKIFLTEVEKDNKLLVGPYMYALTVIGELYELTHEIPVKQQTIH